MAEILYRRFIGWWWEPLGGTLAILLCLAAAVALLASWRRRRRRLGAGDRDEPVDDGGALELEEWPAFLGDEESGDEDP